jgi:hypothetical protein
MVRGRFAGCFICFPQTVHSRCGGVAFGSSLLNMDQLTRFRGVQRATSGILGSYTDTMTHLRRPYRGRPLTDNASSSDSTVYCGTCLRGFLTCGDKNGERGDHCEYYETSGRGSGFSVEAPKGVRFLTRSRVFTDEEDAELEAAGRPARAA